MHRVLLVLILILPATDCRADRSTVDSFGGSIADRIHVSLDRFYAVADMTTIRTARLARYITNSDASYDDTFKIIRIKPENFDSGGNLMRFEDLMRKERIVGQASNIAGVVFHEMAHAEWDRFISAYRGDGDDKRFYALVQTDILPWIETNETEVNAKKCVMEWHGYYVGARVQALLSDWEDILVSHGIYPPTMEINKDTVRNNIKAGLITPEDFGKFVPRVVEHISKDWAQRLDQSYSQRKRGLSLDVSKGPFRDPGRVETENWTVAKGFKDEWWDAIWAEYRAHYAGPATARELLAAMNARYGASLRALELLERALWVENGPGPSSSSTGSTTSASAPLRITPVKVLNQTTDR